MSDQTGILQVHLQADAQERILAGKPCADSAQGKGETRKKVAKLAGVRETTFVVCVLLASLTARILLFPVQGYLSDLGNLAALFNAAAHHWPLVFYQTVYCDWPPFNVYIFWAFGSLSEWLSLFASPVLVYILKLPSTLFDTATASLIFVFLRKRVSFNSALIATTFYAFNPATIFNASIWGQFDAIYTFFLILSIVLILDSNPKLSVVAFTVAVLTKPQSIALAPLIIFLLVRNHSLKTVAASVVTSVAVIFTVSAPVSLNNLADFLVNIYLRGYQEYPYTSANAFNFWALFGLLKSDAQTLLFLNFFQIGWIMFGVLAAFSLYCLYRTIQRTGKTGYAFEMAVLFAAFVLLFGFFMLPTRIHERYLFPVISVLTMMLPFIKESRPLYAVLTITYLANMWYVLQFLNAGISIPAGDPVVYVISVANLAALFYILLVMVNMIVGASGTVLPERIHNFQRHVHEQLLKYKFAFSVWLIVALAALAGGVSSWVLVVLFSPFVLVVICTFELLARDVGDFLNDVVILAAPFLPTDVRELLNCLRSEYQKWKREKI